MKPLTKNDNTNETNKHGGPNSPKIPFLNEYGFDGSAFLLPPQEYHENLIHDKTSGKTGENSKPKNCGDTNSPNMAVFTEHDISGQNVLLLPQ